LGNLIEIKIGLNQQHPPLCPKMSHLEAESGRDSYHKLLGRPYLTEETSRVIALETLQHADFARLEGDTFSVAQPAGALPLVLSSARVLGHHHPGATRDAYALLFCGPAGLHLPQGIHRLEHPALGAMEIFLAQVSGNPQGSEFEAIFT